MIIFFLNFGGYLKYSKAKFHHLELCNKENIGFQITFLAII